MDVSDAEWRQKLTPEQYHILREKGTEAPFSGEFFDHHKDGTYTCAACGTVLFGSKDKYDSHLPGLDGWPSFATVIEAGTVELKPDNGFGMQRTEVVCKTCGSHLGHLFDGDPDSPTGQHYCINSASLDFVSSKQETTNG